MIRDSIHANAIGGAVAAAVLGYLVVGCSPSGLTAHVAHNPVLFGPVECMAPRGRAETRTACQNHDALQSTVFAIDARKGSSSDGYTTTTYWSLESNFDAAVIESTAGSAEGRVRISELKCSAGMKNPVEYEKSCSATGSALAPLEPAEDESGGAQPTPSGP